MTTPATLPIRELSLSQLTRLLALKRARRRRLGWFDFCTDSHDMRTTECRALRVVQRLRGRREPLCNTWGKAISGRPYLD